MRGWKETLLKRKRTLSYVHLCTVPLKHFHMTRWLTNKAHNEVTTLLKYKTIFGFIFISYQNCFWWSCKKTMTTPISDSYQKQAFLWRPNSKHTAQVYVHTKTGQLAWPTDEEYFLLSKSNLPSNTYYSLLPLRKKNIGYTCRIHNIYDNAMLKRLVLCCFLMEK